MAKAAAAEARPAEAIIEARAHMGAMLEVVMEAAGEKYHVATCEAYRDGDLGTQDLPEPQ